MAWVQGYAIVFLTFANEWSDECGLLQFYESPVLFRKDPDTCWPHHLWYRFKKLPKHCHVSLVSARKMLPWMKNMCSGVKQSVLFVCQFVSLSVQCKFWRVSNFWNWLTLYKKERDVCVSHRKQSSFTLCSSSCFLFNVGIVHHFNTVDTLDNTQTRHMSSLGRDHQQGDFIAKRSWEKCLYQHGPGLEEAESFPLK